MLSPKLQLRVAQKQILTPGLVQMVTLLQLNRLELKDMITQEMSDNPFLEESAELGDELTPQEVQTLLEAERIAEPSDSKLMETMNEPPAVDGADGVDGAADFEEAAPVVEAASASVAAPEEPQPAAEPADSFDEIDFGSYFDDYLDPGYKSPASESVEKPSFETFLSSPVTLGQHLRE